MTKTVHAAQPERPKCTATASATAFAGGTRQWNRRWPDRWPRWARFVPIGPETDYYGPITSHNSKGFPALLSPASSRLPSGSVSYFRLIVRGTCGLLTTGRLADVTPAGPMSWAAPVWVRPATFRAAWTSSGVGVTSFGMFFFGSAFGMSPRRLDSLCKRHRNVWSPRVDGHTLSRWVNDQVHIFHRNGT